jgi:hypothetical protein
MAPGFDQLSDHDFQEEDDEIDFSDLQERYDVRMEEGLDTFVVSLVLDEPPEEQVLMFVHRLSMDYQSSTTIRSQS